jgi:PIN domain nuclease of toxin-antitoxin system
MKLLLDTHIWLWSLLKPDKIGRKTAAALKSAQVEKWLSPISIWEFLILAQKGRIQLAGMEPAAWTARALSEFPVKEAPLTAEVVLEMPGLALPHRDPADAFLVATAKAFDLTLVTSDARLLGLKSIPVVANR